MGKIDGGRHQMEVIKTVKKFLRLEKGVNNNSRQIELISVSIRYIQSIIFNALMKNCYVYINIYKKRA